MLDKKLANNVGKEIIVNFESVNMLVRVIGYSEGAGTLIVGLPVDCDKKFGVGMDLLCSDDIIAYEYKDTYDCFAYVCPNSSEIRGVASDFIGKKIKYKLDDNDEEKEGEIIGYNSLSGLPIIGVPNTSEVYGWDYFTEGDMVCAEYKEKYKEYLYLTIFSTFKIVESVDEKPIMGIKEYMEKYIGKQNFFDGIIGREVKIDIYGRIFDTLVVGYDNYKWNEGEILLIIGVPVDLDFEIGWNFIHDDDYIDPKYENMYSNYLYVGLDNISGVGAKYKKEHKVRNAEAVKKVKEMVDTMLNEEPSIPGVIEEPTTPRSPSVIVEMKNGGKIIVDLPIHQCAKMEMLEKIKDDYNNANNSDMLLLGYHLILKKHIKNMLVTI